MQNKLKVLHLSSEKTWRGGEQQIAYLIDELTGSNVACAVAARKDSSFEQHCLSKNIPHVSLPFRNTMDITTALAIKRFCIQESIDIMHAHSAKSHGIAVLSAFLGNKVPVVLSRRVDFVPKNSFITRWRYNHRSIRAILGVSEKITSIMKAFVSRPERCLTVHSGIDTSRFQNIPQQNVLRREYAVAEEFKLIGNTSALADHKDYYTFLMTIQELVKRNILVKAFIVGKGELEAELKNTSKAMGLDGIVFFTGFRNDLNEVLRSLDVFLMTSKTEGLGTSVLDAFACNVPVVATAAGGIPEMVEHKYSGLLAPVGDWQKLADHVSAIIADHHLKDELVKGANQKLSMFSKKATAEKTIAVYEQILKRHETSR
jgi:L-malate glycosyltransferase